MFTSDFPLKSNKMVNYVRSNECNAMLTCSHSGQNQSPSGMTMIGGRRHAVWYPASQRSHSSICRNTQTLRHHLTIYLHLTAVYQTNQLSLGFLPAVVRGKP